MLCLNYIVASLQCAQCRKYATHICGISFPVWLVVFGVCIPKHDAHIYIYTKREQCYDHMPRAKALGNNKK